MSDLPPADEAQQHDHQNEQERQHDQRNGGAVRHVAGVDADLEAEIAQDLGRVDWAALGQEIDDTEIGEGEDRAENQSDDDNRRDHRQDDLVVAAPEPGAVDDGGVDDVLRHRGDAGEEDHDRKRKEAPGVDDGHAQHRQMGIAEPIRRVGSVDDVEGDHRPVDHAVKRVEHPLPGDRGERHRHHPGQNDQGAHQLASGERAQQEQGAEFAEDKADDLRAEGEDEGVEQCGAKDVAAKDLEEISQADEMIALIVDRIGADRVIDREQEGGADQRQDVENRRRDEDRPENGGAVEDEPERRASFGEFFGDGDHRGFLASEAVRPLAVLVEVAERAVVHGEGVPFAGPDAVEWNMRRRQLGRHLADRLEPFERAIDDALGAEIFGAVDAEPEIGDGAAVDHLLGQEMLRPEADM